MANRDQLTIIRDGALRWNTWRNQHYDEPIDLRDADLRGIDLSQLLLGGADLRDTDLQQASLQDTDLRFADLSRANLAHADLSRAHVGWTMFGNVDLSKATGLETVRHMGPSTIGIDTLYSSQGQIPTPFLIGAGVPETLLPAISDDITLNGERFPSCFISHATADAEFAGRLKTDLQHAGVRCWFAPTDLQGGRKLFDQLYDAIRAYDKLLLILSEASINSSWVQTEIWETRQQEQHLGIRKLFPITLISFDSLRKWRCFDSDSGRDMARDIREYFIPDFSRWRDDAHYQRALHNLIMNLRH